MSITNRIESDVYISLESTFLKNLSGFQPTARISFGSKNQYENLFIQIDRIDNARSQIASLKPSDYDTNGFVCFRRENKIALCCQVIPFLCETDNHVKIAFNLNYYLNHDMQALISPLASSSISSPTSILSSKNQNIPSCESLSGSFQNTLQTTNYITQTIYIDFGPLKLEDGLKVVNKPKYIDDSYVISNQK